MQAWEWWPVDVEPSSLGVRDRLTQRCLVLSPCCLQVVAAPIAAGLLMLNGKLGLQGWQWLFLVEGEQTGWLAAFFVGSAHNTMLRVANMLPLLACLSANCTASLHP